MKPAQLFLIFSMVANVVLGMIWIRRSMVPETVIAAPPPKAAIPSVKPPASALSALDEHAWENLKAGGDAALVARLKAGGFPPEIMGIIISAQLEERFAARRKALNARRQRTSYWQYGYPQLMEADDPEVRAQLRALNREYSDAYQQLTSGNPSLLPEYERVAKQRQFGALPPYKIQALEAINRDYDEIVSQTREDTHGISFPGDKEKLRLIESERHADIARTLTPAELEAYDLRNGEIANGVRYQLGVFNPSEEEFKALYQVQVAYEQRYADANLTPDESREYREAEVSKVLSPERFAEYQTTTSGSYQEVRNVVNRFQLPTSTIGDVIRLQRDIVKRANVVRADLNLTPIARDAQLSSLAAEATARLTTAIGPAGVNQYRPNWLQQLLPAPKK